MKKRIVTLLLALCLMLSALIPVVSADEALLNQLLDEVSDLSGMEAFEFFNTLADRGLSQGEIIDFFVKIPISTANQEVYNLYTDDALDIYAESAPEGVVYGNYEWKLGDGTEITGPYTGNTNLKMAYTDYMPVSAGPIADTGKTYRIGVVAISAIDSWMGNLYDSIQYETGLHDNIELVWMDYGLDSSGCDDAIEMLISQQVDAILLWPRTEAATASPAKKAMDAGIPVITVDRLCGYSDITGTVSGNFPANGAQCGAYLVWKLAQESNGESISGNIILLRKAAGVTADTLRCGPFLKVISYFPDIHILHSYFDNDDTEQGLINAQNALQLYDNIDAVFCEGLTQTPLAVEAITSADRWNSRENGEKIIMLTIDDTKESFALLENGTIEMNCPYTPLIGDIGVRYLIKMFEGEELPKDIAIPNIPLVTVAGETIFGLKSMTYEEWYQYASGPDYAAQ
jgi:ABC-type sugar transport system substrate-binding protein